ncbi:MAG TPA: type III-B CRISPR module-associated protein Cmr5, partial [Ktedonobacterales bacterium]|nr:type III-B CRISPR module-associated protein Cmr5 [Ktedonobacterales bacterium]
KRIPEIGTAIETSARNAPTWIGAINQAQYRQARAETLAILLWLQRFADGELKDENAGASATGVQDAQPGR